MSKPLVNSTLIALTYKDLDLSTWRDARFRTKYYDVTPTCAGRGAYLYPLMQQPSMLPEGASMYSSFPLH